jgi:hypothetical protein
MDALAQANLHHPVVMIAEQIVRRAEDGRFSIDPAGMAILEYALERHGADPALPGAVLGLFCLAAGLTQEGAADVAGALLECVVRMRPKLTALSSHRPSEAAAELGVLALKAPQAFEPKPEGTVEAKSFVNPGMQLPHGVRKRVAPSRVR